MDRRAFVRVATSVVAAGPLAALAQPSSMPVVGFLNGGSPDGFALLATAFRRGLAEAGFVEGQNVAIEYRWAEGHDDRVPAMVAGLVQRPVALIAVGGGHAARRAATAATTTIPIVFFSGGDPVKDGFVASLGRPGGNVTGVVIVTTALDAKRLELLNELVPPRQPIAVLVNATSSWTEAQLQDIQAAARTMGRKIHVLNANTEREIDAAFASLSQLHAAALLVTSDPLLFNRRQQIIELTARQRIPAIFEWREFVVAGGLLSYGSSIANGYREVGIYAGRILKGAKPADLPVLQATKYELVINMKTAKSLGVSIPQSLLLRADEVIQ